MNDRPNIATLLDEPADGTNLVIRDSNGEWHLIRRDDQEAHDRIDEAGDERWFSSEWSDPEPETWASILAFAVAVYPVDAKPLAELPALTTHRPLWCPLPGDTRHQP